MQVKNRNIIIVALAATGSGVSGSDRIFIEFAKVWSLYNSIVIITSKDGKRMCKALGLFGDKVEIRDTEFVGNLFTQYIKKIFFSIKYSFEIKTTSKDSMVFSSSDFIMDVLPSFIIKHIRKQKIIWCAGWFQTAPNPLSGFAGGRYRFKALLYWLSQSVCWWLIKFADKILVNNESEKQSLSTSIDSKKISVVLGAVHIPKQDSELKAKKYDAVFIGRFHPQKGVVELITIWSYVTKLLPNSILVMIGDGSLMPKVTAEINKYSLNKNVILKGFLFDGKEKENIFKSSKLVVHPAFYDSGGMASAEGMVHGLPLVAFDLDSYKDYFPVGVVKVPKFSLEKFANTVTSLINNNKQRQQLGDLAKKYVTKNWSWDCRAKNTLEGIYEEN